MSEQIPTEFNSDTKVSVPIIPDLATQRRQRRQERKAMRAAEANQFQKFGMGLMKVKIKNLAALGLDIDKLGIKHVGHGKIAVSGDNAQNCIEDLIDIVHELRSRNPPADPAIIIEAMALLKGFNEQVMESGKSHINATKQVEQGNTGSTLTIPFPAGAPMVIGLSSQKPLQVEGDTSQG